MLKKKNKNEKNLFDNKIEKNLKKINNKNIKFENSEVIIIDDENILEKFKNKKIKKNIRKIRKFATSSQRNKKIKKKKRIIN